ncbi:MAG: hypothetical protein HF973_10750 [Chloroflexi bacterium]|nr:hypothetical protein [Chloroflexota bacterium]
MPSLQVGQLAPDVVLSDVAARPYALSDFWGNGRAALLIFLPLVYPSHNPTDRPAVSSLLTML